MLLPKKISIAKMSSHIFNPNTIEAENTEIAAISYSKFKIC